MDKTKRVNVKRTGLKEERTEKSVWYEMKNDEKRRNEEIKNKWIEERKTETDHNEYKNKKQKIIKIRKVSEHSTQTIRLFS